MLGYCQSSCLVIKVVVTYWDRKWNTFRVDWWEKFLVGIVPWLDEFLRVTRKKEMAACLQILSPTWQRIIELFHCLNSDHKIDWSKEIVRNFRKDNYLYTCLNTHDGKSEMNERGGKRKSEERNSQSISAEAHKPRVFIARSLVGGPQREGAIVADYGNAF